MFSSGSFSPRLSTKIREITPVFCTTINVPESNSKYRIAVDVDPEMTPSLNNQPFSHSAEAAVLSAFNDARYDFRTTSGIADALGLTEECVKELVERLLRQGEVRVSPVRDGHGRSLYTLASRPRTAQEILSETRAFLAGAAK